MSAEQLIINHLDLWTDAVTTKSASGRGNNGKIEFTGIKKLREVILELAVQGQLLPQHTSDESAHELLKKISESKKRWLKEQPARKLRSMSGVPDEEKRFKLPENWAWTRLANLLRVINGRAYKKHEMLHQGTPLLRVGNLFTSNDWYYSDLELEHDKYIDKGDLIYAWSASFGPFIWDGGRAIYHYHIWKLDLFDTENIDKNYLFLFLQAVTEEIKSSGSGIAMIHMTKAKMEELVIPIPPIAEQHRIVQKVDELMALCDRLEQQTRDQHAAHETLVDALLDTLTQSKDADELADNWARLAAHFDTLFTTEQSVERLKRSVIQLAISGSLTNQAGNTEPPAVLLRAIAEQRKALIQPNKLRKPALSRRASKSAELFSLPRGWQWGVLEDLFVIVTDGDHQAPPKSPSGIPFLTIGNVNTGSINFHDCRHVPPEYYESLDWTRRPGKNDLLYTVTGSYGIAVPVTSHKAFCVQRHIAILKSVDATPIPYVLLFLRSQLAFDYVEKSVTGIAQKTLSLSALRKMPIPIPPLEEQKRLVKQSDKLMMLCDQIKARVKQASETRCQIAEAIVEQAIH